MGFAWFKGHGTENDFILLPDHDGSIHGDLDPAFVARLCDRRTGIGADGVLRVIRSTVAGHNSPGEWFMDYRNADGSISEMCGNGVRGFARHLVDEGLVEGNDFSVHTRDGLKFVTVTDDAVTVDMGGYTVGHHSKVGVTGHTWSALEVNTGNPHAVAIVGSLHDAGSLTDQPSFDTGVFPAGVNIEFVERVRDGVVRMRVHERGSGETRSCGTGACAVGIALAAADHAGHPATYEIHVPGGVLNVEVDKDRTMLTGPAEIVAGGTMEWFV
ncbi:MAG: diaminopimelate epimerase [Aeromicrobium sp.]|nr:MAG: diaminopimelate epimerase [Aeromicrobium sp.]